MAGVLAGECSYSASGISSHSRNSHEKQEEVSRMYFGRREIEKNSPSRLDGIDLKKETYLRKSYCTFLQDLGMKLKVPQVTIATAIFLCHRFFFRQSHAKNDRRIIATVCMFLAGKAEETPRPLKDVINFSYEIINEKDPGASQKIKQKELYERQKELILNGEKIVLSTLAFDLNVYHPYRPLVKAIKKFKEVYEQQKELILNGEKIVLSTLAFDLDVCHPYKSLAEAIKNFKVAQNALAQEVYEKQKELILNGERIVLSTLAFDVNVYHPYKPHGEAINKFKVAQSALAQVVWSSLAQVAWNFVNDSLRTSLCLQFKPHHIAAGAIFLAAKFLKVKLPSDGEKVWWQEFDVTPQQLEDVSIQMLELYEQIPVPPSQGSEVESSVGGGSAHLPGSRNAELADEHTGSRQTSVRPTHEHSSSDYNGSSSKSLLNQYNDNGGVEAANASVDHKDEIERETKGSPHPKSHPANKDYMREALHNSTPKVEGPGKDKSEREGGELKDDGSVHKSRNVDVRNAPISQSPKDLKLLQDIVKAKREKAKKLLGERTRKKDWMDEDDLLEDVELAVEDEKTKQRKVQSRPKVENSDLMDTEHGEIVELKEKVKNTEEGEMVNYVSPTMHSRKRKMGSPPEKLREGKRRHNSKSGEEGLKTSRASSHHGDRIHRRHSQENYH